MPSMPKRVKHRKVQRGNNAGLSQRCNELDFGEFGLQTLDRAYDNSGALLSSKADKKYILDGNGNPIIISETPPVVCGIAVVAKNISAETEYKIVRLLQAVYGISSNRISVQS